MRGVESARSAIRYFRGAKGDKFRKYADPRFARDFDVSSFNPFGLPESDEVEYLPFKLPPSVGEFLCLYDVHVPFHSVGSVDGRHSIRPRHARRHRLLGR